MLSNGTMNEARAQAAIGSIGAPPSPPSKRAAHSSGIELAKERIGELHRMLTELDNHLEVQVARLTGPYGTEDGGSQCQPICGGAVGELHDYIDGLFSVVNRIGVNAARLDQI